jgi:hypothetical protein
MRSDGCPGAVCEVCGNRRIVIGVGDTPDLGILDGIQERVDQYDLGDQGMPTGQGCR